MHETETIRAGLQGLIDRRQFTSAALMALLGGVTVTVLGCDSSSSPTAPSDGARAGSVSANHGHTATITSAQLTAGQGVTLDIRGSADHLHTVVLTVAEVGQIASGQRVSKSSTAQSSLSEPLHSHTVVFN